MSDARAVLLPDPRSPAVRADPYPVYAALRAAAPLYFDAAGRTWYVTGYEPCRALLRDRRVVNVDTATWPDDPAPLAGLKKKWLLFLNPPDHTRVRKLVQSVLTPQRVADLQPTVERLTDQLLARVEPAKSMDVMADLAYPLPVALIAEIMGVPAADRQRFRQWADALAGVLDVVVDAARLNRALDAAVAFSQYLEDLFADRRDEPRDDLLTHLVQAAENGELSQVELCATCIFLLIAGFETTANLIGNGLLALLRAPGELRKLQDDPALIDSAVDELLRFDAPVQLALRTVREEIEHPAGTIHPGEMIYFFLGAANRDPAYFSAPDVLDITRNEAPHLTFGAGIHYCLGAPLARLEGQVAIRQLLARTSKLRLELAAPRFREHFLLRGLETLPISWQ